MTNDGAETSLRVVIDGRVQGVGFRHWVHTEAERRGLTGWVRNRVDGRVEAVFQGQAEAVEQMVEACRKGPALSRVTAVTTKPEAGEPAAAFQVLPTA